jgi:hypothetical protein
LCEGECGKAGCGKEEVVGVEVVRKKVVRVQVMRMNVMVKVARMKLVAVCWVLRGGGEEISLVEDDMLPFTL